MTAAKRPSAARLSKALPPIPADDPSYGRKDWMEALAEHANKTEIIVGEDGLKIMLS